MTSQANVESLSQKIMLDYVKACACRSLSDVNDALAVLTQSCAEGLCAAVGQNKAVAQLEKIAFRLAETLPGVDWTKGDPKPWGWKFLPSRRHKRPLTCATFGTGPARPAKRSPLRRVPNPRETVASLPGKT